jgi:hypothetical protein
MASVGCNSPAQPTAEEWARTREAMHLTGPVRVTITVSNSHVKSLIETTLRAELSKVADIRFTSGEESTDLTIDVLISDFPNTEDGYILQVNTETHFALMLRARELDKDARLPASPYAARKVVKAQDVPAACAEIASAIRDAVFEKYLKLGRAAK